MRQQFEVIDLFCGGGCSASGLKQAAPKSNITGFDIAPQLDYPFNFVRADWKEADLSKFDFAWASPPCQRYSRGGNVESRKRYPDLVAPVRDALINAGIPFVIENVEGAPLRKDLLLCGAMFDLKVKRHRIFEIHGFKCRQPPLVCQKHKGKIVSGEYIMVCRGGRAGCYGNKEMRNKLKAPTLETASVAMGVSHVTNFNTIVEGIPPAYAKYIMEEFLRSRSIKCKRDD